MSNNAPETYFAERGFRLVVERNLDSEPPPGAASRGYTHSVDLVRIETGEVLRAYGLGHDVESAKIRAVKRWAAEQDPGARDDRLRARLAVLEAVSLAAERRWDILDAIAEARDPDQARRAVAAILGIEKDSAAAEAVIELRLRRLSQSEIAGVRGEADSIREALQDRGL